MSIVPPYGGSLIDLVAPAAESAALRAEAIGLTQIPLPRRAQLDLELLSVGGCSPLTTFMGESDYRAVCENMRLADGRLFPIPVTLPIPDGLEVNSGSRVSLCDEVRRPLAILRVDEIYERDWRWEARHLYGSEDLVHPVIAEMANAGRRAASGTLQVFRLPVHHDFADLRLTPAVTRERLTALSRPHVLAVHATGIFTRLDEDVTEQAFHSIDATLLVHPAVGITRPADPDPFTRVRSYRRVVSASYARDRVLLALAPLADRMAGPREAVWHAIVRRNYGASHFVVRRTHADAGCDSRGRAFFPPGAAAALATALASEIGVSVVVPPENPEGAEPGAARLRPQAAEALARTTAPAGHRGFCVWITGLSGAGKTTLAELLAVRLQERGRRVTQLDGDIMRATVSADLGFSRQDRDANVRRIGFVAAEAVRHHGAVVCACLSPYATTRADVRQMIGREAFVLVYLDTPINVCRRRDPKGMYARADRGLGSAMTGVAAPFEAPDDADVSLSTEHLGPEEIINTILRDLERRGFILPLAGEV